MHLTRTSVLRLLLPKPPPGRAMGQLRFASSGHHTHEEHGEDADYIPEGGFSTPFWRNTLILSLLGVSFYKWAPPRDNDAYLTRWIGYYATPSETWAQLNEKHMLQSQQVTDNMTVQGRATRPGIIRYRYPQSLEQASPHLQAVGSDPSVSSVGARTD